MTGHVLSGWWAVGLVLMAGLIVLAYRLGQESKRRKDDE